MAARNNIAKLPPILRDKVSELLYQNTLTQEEIEAAVRAEAIRAGLPDYAEVRLHGTSFLAWRESPDFREYVEFARGWGDQVRKRRWAASKLNEGRGPQSLADLAASQILEQLYELAQDGERSGKDVATIARAIATMQRTQLARELADKDNQIRAIETEHQAELATLQAKLAEKDAEIQRLNAILVERGKKDGAVDPEERARVMAAVDQYMGGPAQ